MSDESTTGEWTSQRIVKFLGLPSSKTEDCSFLADAINAALAAEQRKSKAWEQDALRYAQNVNYWKEQLAAERRKNDDWRNTERRVAKERDEARQQLVAAQNQISMDTECIERIRNHGMKLEIELAAEREKATS